MIGVRPREALGYAELSDSLADVQRIRGAHRALGNWTLAQTCKHLADTIQGSMDGFDLSRHRLKRWFIAKRLLAHTYVHGIPKSYTVDPRLTPPPGVDLDAAIADLEEAIARYRDHRGPLHPHPLFGRLSREGWDRLHCFHAAHHLRLIVPVDATKPSETVTNRQPATESAGCNQTKSNE